MESILNSIKKLLGITPEYTAFDVDIVMHINTTFMILNQLGIGPERGYSIIDDNNVWSEYLDENDPNYESVKTYIYLKVRSVFDPPASSIVMESMKRMIDELEWRMNVNAETGRKDEMPDEEEVY